MPANLLTAARKYNESAVVELLEGYYAVIHRMTYALCGDGALGETAAAAILRRAMKILPRWRDDSTADRWFYRHTVLESRRYEMAPRRSETLIPSGQSAEDYAAFVRALRGLPVQQREAVLLHYGEHLNDRYLGMAMDCSADAAANHLAAATRQLLLLSGDRFSALIDQLAAAYRGLAIPPETARPVIQRRVKGYFRPRKLRRWILRAAFLGCAIAVIVWWHSIRAFAAEIAHIFH